MNYFEMNYFNARNNRFPLDVNILLSASWRSLVQRELVIIQGVQRHTYIYITNWANNPGPIMVEVRIDPAVGNHFWILPMNISRGEVARVRVNWGEFFSIQARVSSGTGNFRITSGWW